MKQPTVQISRGNLCSTLSLHLSLLSLEVLQMMDFGHFHTFNNFISIYVYLYMHLLRIIQKSPPKKAHRNVPGPFKLAFRGFPFPQLS